MRQYLRPGFAVPYGVVLVIAVVSIIFFGWAGFWLGLSVLVLVKVARWGIPLIRLSYQEAPPVTPAEQVADDAPGESVEARR